MADEGQSGSSGAPAGGGGSTITSEIAAQLLMVTAERVRQLARAGWIAKAGPNQYRLVDVVQGYIRFRNDADRRAQKTAAESRVRDARAREIELKIAKAEGQLIEIADAEAAADMLVGFIRQELAGLPARVTRDLSIRRTIEQAVNDILSRAADFAQQATDDPSTDGDVAPAGEDDDAGPVGGGEP